MKVLAVVTGIMLSLGAAGVALAVPTDVTVRVLSKDAKFIGSSMGGVQITMQNVDTGELMAKGIVAGTTGNTELIMKRDRARGMRISDDKSGKFNATFDIDEPTLVKVTAYGPLAQRQSAGKVSQTQWVVPGKDITGGDAWLLEMPGLVVDVQAPSTHLKLKEPEEVTIKANVTMM